MAKIKNRVGEVHITAEGYKVEIIEYLGTFECVIKFEDGHTQQNVKYSAIKSGEVKNYYHKSICNIGYFGQGAYKAAYNNSIRIRNRFYNVWSNMIRRCYDEQYQERLYTYKGCSVDERWHNFQVFAEWYENNYNFNTMNNWHLDKDILVKGNKVYSPETCCFVPNEINIQLTKRQNDRGKYPIGIYLTVEGRYKVQLSRDKIRQYLGRYDDVELAFQAYKTAKEEYIKEIADKWKPKLAPQTYQALMNYTVEITD
jgi:hypothetical protein